MPVSTSPPPPSDDTTVPVGAGVRVGSSGTAAPGRAAARPTAGGRSNGILRAMVQFGVPGLAALVLVGLGATVVLRERGEAAAIREARQMTRTIGVGMIQPRLTDGVVTGDAAAVAQLDAYVRRHVLPLDPAIVRVKLWSAESEVIYADEPQLIGKRFTLGATERAALWGRSTSAEISDLASPENVMERGGGRLLEVYQPLRTPQARPVLFEVYMRYSAVAADARDIWSAFAPVLVVALMLLWLIQLPLAWSFAGRLRQGQRQREELLEQAIVASVSERRRVAGDLHDGVVQDLAGVALTLSAAAGRATEPEAIAAMTTASTRTRQSIRQMRSLLVDIYPAKLHSAGLQRALPDLLAPLAARGLRTEAGVAADLAPSREVEQLVFRTAQEGLRNVLLHADADEVRLEAGLQDGVVRLTIEDDGCGFVLESSDWTRDGHLGLTLLGDRAADLGGHLTIHSAPGAGTRLTLEVPTG